MAKRVRTAAILLTAGTALMILGGWFTWVTLTLMSLVSIKELYGAIGLRGIRPVKWVGYLFALMSLFVLAFGERIGIGVAEGVLWSVALCALTGACAVVVHGKPDMNAFFYTLAPILYPGVFWFFFLRLQTLGSWEGRLALFMTVLVPSLNDTFALFTGARLGRHPLSKELSPHKTREGAAAGIVGSMLAAVLVPVLFRALACLFAGEGPELFPLWQYLLFGLVCAPISQMGDLAASLIKRACGIKDFGNLFPGHGGMLDRMDAMLFTSVAVYAFFLIGG